MKHDMSQRSATSTSSGRTSDIFPGSILLSPENGILVEEVVTSRHSRLSGIVVVYNILIKDDSGQAGMTSKGVGRLFTTSSYCIGTSDTLHDLFNTAQTNSAGGDLLEVQFG